MADQFIIAEAAQGYEGDPMIARLLVRAAAKAGADAVKFQIIYADDVAVSHYQYYELFRQLEMSAQEWGDVRDTAREFGISFYTDISGPRSLDIADKLDVDGVKIHSTCFFESPLLDWALSANVPALLSVGGIAEDEVKSLIAERGLAGSQLATIMHGYQAEPTPTDKNALARIPRLRDIYGIDIGFMDHADGAGPDTISLSAMALALGVRVFEKHITLDRALELEDYVSALPPSDFANYVSAIRRLAGAMGSAAGAQLEEERIYRNKALKRVVATRHLSAGTSIAAADVTLLRPAVQDGLFDLRHAVGRTLKRAVDVGTPIFDDDLR